MNLFQKGLKLVSLPILIGIVMACANKSKTESAEFFERGNYHFKKNETERALELFTEAIDKVPDFADAFNNRGLCYEKLGNIEKAKNDYRKAVELDDTFDKAKLNLASALLQIGELKECDALLKKLAPIYADSSQFYDLRGKYFIQASSADAAISDLQMSLELNPFNVETLTNLGYAFYLKKDYENAKEAFINVLAEKPDFGFALNNLSATYCQLNDWNEASHYSEMAVKQQPNEILFINTHTLNLLETNQLEKASIFIEQALKLQPENPYSLRNLGVLQMKSEEFKQAMETLKGVESSNPEVEFVYFYLGDLFKSFGNSVEACKAFQRGAILGDLRSQKEDALCKK